MNTLTTNSSMITFGMPEVQKKMRAYHKDLREKWGTSDKLTVTKGDKPNSKKITIGMTKYGLSMELYLEDNNVVCRSISISGTSYPEIYLEKATAYLFGLSRSLELDKVLIILTYEEEKRKKFLLNTGFERSLVPSETEWQDEDFCYTMDMLHGKFHVLRDWNTELKHVGYQMKKEDASFEFKYMNAEADLVRYSMYYKGISDVVSMWLSPEGILLRLEKTDKTCIPSNKDELSAVFTDMLENAAVESSLIHLVNPPRKHFDEFIKRRFPVGNANADELFDFLLKFHDSLEIDQYFSKKEYVLVDDFTHQQEEIRFVRIFDCFVLYEANELDDSGEFFSETTQRIYCFKSSEKQAAFDAYKKSKMKRYELSVNYDIKYTFDSSDKE